MVQTISLERKDLKALIKELLKEVLRDEPQILHEAVVELIQEKEALPIEDAEVRLLANRQFEKYAAVFKALA